MIERNEKLIGRSWVLTPETGLETFGKRLAGQNEWFAGQFDGTASVRQPNGGNFGGFFRRMGSSPSQTLEDLEYGTGQNPEHQVTYHLGGSSNADEHGAKIVLEMGVDPLGGRPLFEALGRCWGQGDFLVAARVGIDDSDGRKHGFVRGRRNSANAAKAREKKRGRRSIRKGFERWFLNRRVVAGMGNFRGNQMQKIRVDQSADP